MFQYVVRITPDEFCEADKARAIFRTKARAIEAAIGTNFFSGNNIYTLNEIAEDVSFDTNFRGTACQISIEVEDGNQIELDANFINKETSLSQNIINCIIKEAFRETDLKQIGKTPRFFDIKNPTEFSSIGLRMWEGFKASALNTKIGLTLTIDSIFKFVTTQTCL